MNNYYFTFGQGHETRSGKEMKDYWVRVIADNYDNARIVFCERFAGPIMGDQRRWAFQYEEEFSEAKHYYPKGEYCCIKQ